MRRIGVFVCHCGTNIAATVDVKTVAETLEKSRQSFMRPTIPICAQRQAKT